MKLLGEVLPRISAIKKASLSYLTRLSFRISLFRKKAAWVTDRNNADFNPEVEIFLIPNSQYSVKTLQCIKFNKAKITDENKKISKSGQTHKI